MDIKKLPELVAEISALKGQRKRGTALPSLRSGEFTSVEALAAHMEALLQG